MKTISYFTSKAECRTHGYESYSDNDIRARLREITPCLRYTLYEAYKLLNILRDRALNAEEMELIDSIAPLYENDFFYDLDDEEIEEWNE